MLLEQDHWQKKTFHQSTLLLPLKPAPPPVVVHSYYNIVSECLFPDPVQVNMARS